MSAGSLNVTGMTPAAAMQAQTGMASIPSQGQPLQGQPQMSGQGEIGVERVGKFAARKVY
jgi:hypothetical protein